MEENELKSETSKQTPLEEAVSRMQSQGGTLTAKVSVTRKDSGKVEDYTLVMTPAKE